MGIFKSLYPVQRAASTYDIDFQGLYDKGYRGLIFDIDNTLVGHGEPADERAVRLFDDLRTIGFDTCLISNNQEPRVAPFAKSVKSRYVFDAHKPSPGHYLKACELMGLEKDKVLFIGDQIFTDVWGANRAGIRSILVGRLYFHEEIQIHLKRILEKIVMAFYPGDREL